MIRHDVKLHFTNITQPKVHIIVQGNKREGGLINPYARACRHDDWS